METYFVGLALQCFQLLVYAPDVYDGGDPHASFFPLYEPCD
jgi:hypothetical protein